MPLLIANLPRLEIITKWDTHLARNHPLPCHSERAERIELFPPRSRMALRTIRSSLCSDFDYAQDDTVEKAQGGSRSGISAGQRKKVAISTTFQEFGTPSENRTHN